MTLMSNRSLVWIVNYPANSVATSFRSLPNYKDISTRSMKQVSHSCVRNPIVISAVNVKMAYKDIWVLSTPSSAIIIHVPILQQQLQKTVAWALFLIKINFESISQERIHIVTNVIFACNATIYRKLLNMTK